MRVDLSIRILPVLPLLLAACVPVATAPSTTPAATATAPFAQTLIPIPQTATPPVATSLPTMPSHVQPLDFELLGIPGSYNPAPSHWSLWDLQLWHDRIYLAHGDWFGNTGPVRMLYLDLETGEFVHDEGFVVEEESIEVFRVYSDTLYVPGADPTENWDFGNLYIKRWGEPWVKRHSIPSAIHLWDVALIDETLVVTGRTAVDNRSFGVVWTSADDGRSWEWGPDFQTAGYAEAFSLFVLKGRLFAATVGTGCLVFDGSAWGKADCLLSDIFEGTALVHRTALFEDVIVMVPYWCGSDTRLHLFDGEERWTIEFGEPVRDAVVTENGLFVLAGLPAGEGTIFHASNLACHCPQDFTRIVELDLKGGEPSPEGERASACPLGSTPQSLEYAENRFYVGLTDGRLFRSALYRP